MKRQQQLKKTKEMIQAEKYFDVLTEFPGNPIFNESKSSKNPIDEMVLRVMHKPIKKLNIKRYGKETPSNYLTDAIRYGATIFKMKN